MHYLLGLSNRGILRLREVILKLEVLSQVYQLTENDGKYEQLEKKSTVGRKGELQKVFFRIHRCLFYNYIIFFIT